MSFFDLRRLVTSFVSSIFSYIYQRYNYQTNNVEGSLNKLQQMNIYVFSFNGVRYEKKFEWQM